MGGRLLRTCGWGGDENEETAQAVAQACVETAS